MNKFKRYSRYQSSGVKWLGDIPENWGFEQLGWNTSLTVPMRDKPENLNGTIPWVRIEDFDGKYISGSKSGQGVSEDTVRKMNLKVFLPGTVLCTCSCTMGATAIAKAPLVSNQTFIGILPRFGLDSEYLFYLMKASSDELTQSAAGSIQQYLSRWDFQKLRIPIPSMDEQRSIVAFLDHTTAQLDDLIAQKQRLIELLKEKRQALITQAVTKGLNPKAKMKDSGVPWLGQIPEHWEKFKLGHLFDVMGSGTTPARERLDYYDGNTPWVTTSELRETEITKTNERVTDLALEDFPSLKIYPADSVVVAMYGATIGRLGILRVPATVNQACFVMGQSRLANFKFIYYFLWAIRNHLINLGYGGGQPNLNQEQIRNVRLALPSLKEQEGIVARLDQSVSELDSLTHQTELSVEKLSEYRQSLISAAVTGKIDLRNWKSA